MEGLIGHEDDCGHLWHWPRSTDLHKGILDHHTLTHNAASCWNGVVPAVESARSDQVRHHLADCNQPSPGICDALRIRAGVEGGKHATAGVRDQGVGPRFSHRGPCVYQQTLTHLFVRVAISDPRHIRPWSRPRSFQGFKALRSAIERNTVSKASRVAIVAGAAQGMGQAFSRRLAAPHGSASWQ